MEPFDILSVPAKLGVRYFISLGLGALFTAVIAWGTVRYAVAVALDHDGARTASGAILALIGLGILGAVLWLLYPQTLILRRYYGQDRGKQVLSFRLEERGMRWLQVGTDVLLPWAGMTVAIVGRTEDRMVLEIEQPNPVLLAQDALSRQLHRTLRRKPVTKIPFTLHDPTEDELVAAIERLSRGQVAVSR